ncbi:MAG: response regulator, partial [Bacillota bacterium]
MRILIIEDEIRLAGTLKDMVAQDGHAADIAHDGESGLDNALTGVYDAVVLDVMLHKLNGFEVLKLMRAQGLATPVLMLTARADLADRVQGLNLGADYYLTKPFENAEFRACLRAVL